jgi:hypothetical protein
MIFLERAGALKLSLEKWDLAGLDKPAKIIKV